MFQKASGFFISKRLFLNIDKMQQLPKFTFTAKNTSQVLSLAPNLDAIIAHRRKRKSLNPNMLRQRNQLTRVNGLNESRIVNIPSNWIFEFLAQKLRKEKKTDYFLDQLDYLYFTESTANTFIVNSTKCGVVGAIYEFNTEAEHKTKDIFPQKQVHYGHERTATIFLSDSSSSKMCKLTPSDYFKFNFV